MRGPTFEIPQTGKKIPSIKHKAKPQLKIIPADEKGAGKPNMSPLILYYDDDSKKNSVKPAQRSPSSMATPGIESRGLRTPNSPLMNVPELNLGQPRQNSWQKTAGSNKLQIPGLAIPATAQRQSREALQAMVGMRDTSSPGKFLKDYSKQASPLLGPGNTGQTSKSPSRSENQNFIFSMMNKSPEHVSGSEKRSKV